jgi:hypothetical protein
MLEIRLYVLLWWERAFFLPKITRPKFFKLLVEKILEPV